MTKLTFLSPATCCPTNSVTSTLTSWPGFHLLFHFCSNHTGSGAGLLFHVREDSLQESSSSFMKTRLFVSPLSMAEAVSFKVAGLTWERFAPVRSNLRYVRA